VVGEEEGMLRLGGRLVALDVVGTSEEIGESGSAICSGEEFLGCWGGEVGIAGC
jgi:hypothetical protein